MAAVNKVRLMALEVDSVFETTRERRGTFGDIFHELFTTAGAEHDPPLEVETIVRFVVEPEGGAIPVIEELEHFGVKAVVFSGSKYDAHSDDAWILKLVKWIQGTRGSSRTPSIRSMEVCYVYVADG